MTRMKNCRWGHKASSLTIKYKKTIKKHTHTKTLKDEKREKKSTDMKLSNTHIFIFGLNSHSGIDFYGCTLQCLKTNVNCYV